MADFTTQRYDIVRKRMEQQAGAGADEQRDALKRSFARGGMIGSGAQIKNEQLLENKIASAKQNARESVDAQELADRQRQEEILQSQGFAKAEREASQGFAAAEAARQRKFMGQESAAARSFQAGESALQRGFSEKLFTEEMRFKKEAQRIQESQFAKQFKLAKKQFGLDEEVTRFNMNMAEKMFNKRTIMDKMADPFNWKELPGQKGSGAPGWMGGAANNEATYIPLTAGTGIFGF